jgi:hypothetical protein
MKHANDCRMSAANRADDSSFGPAIRLDVRDLNKNLVAVHGRADCMWRNKDVAGNLWGRMSGTGVDAGPSRLIRNYESKAVAVQAEFAGNEILSLCGLGDAVAIGIYLD